MGTASISAERATAGTGARSAASAPPGAVTQRGKVNVSKAERVASTVLGGLLIAGFAARRRSTSKAAFALVGAELVRRGVTGHCVAYQALGVRTAQDGTGSAADVAVQRSITIGKSADELYGLWRDPATMGQLFGSAAQVTSTGPNRMRWVVQGPRGRQAAWATQIVEDRPGEMVRWASLAGADVPNEGTVSFQPAPNDLGTEVTLSLRVEPPAAAGASVMASLFGGTAGKLLATKVLHRFKSLAETGEVPTLTRQPAARHDGRDR